MTLLPSLVTGNAALAELDMTGLADEGAETTPTARLLIYLG